MRTSTASSAAVHFVTIAALLAHAVPVRAAGTTTVVIDALDAYIPAQNAAYWIVDTPSAQVPVVLSQPVPGGVGIPFVSNAVSSTLFFSATQILRTHTINYSPSGGDQFYPGWFLEFAYFSLLAKQPPGIERGIPYTLYPVRVREVPANGAAEIACPIDWLCALGAWLGWHPAAECSPFAGTGATATGTALFVPTLQRYRNEILATTSAGQFYTDLYQSYANDIGHTIVSSPTLAARLFLARGAWIDGLQAIVDGNGGSFVVSQAMQDDLLALLATFEADGTPALASMLAFERTRLKLDAIAGLPMNTLQNQIETLGGPTAIEPRSWGDVKQMYRGER